MRWAVCGLAALLLFTARAGAQVGEGTEAKTTVAPLPILFYTPETKIGFGAALNVFRRPAGASEESRPSTLTPLLLYTVKNQVVSVLAGSHYWDAEQNNLAGSFSYSNFPDLFHGIGNDTDADLDEDFTTENYGFQLEYLRLLRPKLRAGGLLALGHSRLLEREDGGLLGSGEIIGSDGGWARGLGAKIDFDDRDDITYPTAGGISSLSFTVFDEGLGSDYDFRLSSFESRRYLSPGSRGVLAARATLHHVDGYAPFQLLPALGGDQLLRGYYGGRFRDRDLVALEAEWRQHLWRRLGMVLFGGLGQVGHDPGDLRLDDFHGAFGLGLRILFLSSENLNLRFDVGWGEDEGGSYISLGEAF